MPDFDFNYFDSNGIAIAFMDAGTGPAIVLVHGFASNASVNWVGTGWVDTLVKAGYRVVAFDNRGHGRSEKIYDTARYPASRMARDVGRLMDHLGIKRAHIMGYSMGARIAAFFCVEQPLRVRRAVFAGLGINMIRGTGDPGAVIAALEAPGLEEVTHPKGRMFRRFAEQTGSDLKALAACMRAERTPIDGSWLGRLPMRVLVAVGSADEVAGSATELAALIPHGTVLEIPGRDHMRAVGDPVYKRGVLEFLGAP